MIEFFILAVLVSTASVLIAAAERQRSEALAMVKSCIYLDAASATRARARIRQQLDAAQAFKIAAVIVAGVTLGLMFYM